jgi:hypothetical protein
VENANTAGAVGWCLEVHDLAISKLIAGRAKDLSFVETMLRQQLVSADVLSQRLSETPRTGANVRKMVDFVLNRWRRH